MRNVTLTELKNYIGEGFRNEIQEEVFTIVDKSLDVHILYANGPYEDFVSYSTYGLSKIILDSIKGEVDFGIEIISGAPASEVNYGNVLVVAYEYFLEEQIFLGPGNVLQNAVLKADICANHLPHLYFSMPVYWGDHFAGVRVDDVDIKFLVAFPISENEYRFLKEKDRDIFEDMLMKMEVDIFDPRRESVL